MKTHLGIYDFVLIVLERLPEEGNTKDLSFQKIKKVSFFLNFKALIRWVDFGFGGLIFSLGALPE